jgi:peroxiredoxin
MPVISVVMRVVLAVVFGVAGVAKLADRRGTSEALIAFGVPQSVAGGAALTLPALELGVALLLLAPGGVWWGALGALVLLLVFMAAVGTSLARGRRPDCRCFGQVHARPVGAGTLVRNAVLCAGAVTVLLAGTDGGPGLTAAFSRALQAPAILGIAAMAGLIVLPVQSWLLFHLFRQHGRLLLRLERLQGQLTSAGAIDPSQQMPRGLPVGAWAPSFTSPSPGGRTLSLNDLREPGLPVLLVFTSPGCAPCAALMPEVSRWERTHADTLTIALVSQAPAGASTVPDHGVRRVLLQTDREIESLFDVAGTPSAVLIDTNGLVASSVILGAESIGNLVAQVTARVADGRRPEADKPSGPSPMKRRSRLGEAAPRFTLPDLDGRTVDSTELAGQRTLLLFWNPSCGYCTRMLPQFQAWERERGVTPLTTLVVSTGSAESTRDLQLRSRVLLDRHFALGRLFGVSGTPSALVIAADGTIASDVAVGEPEVLALAYAQLASFEVEPVGGGA